MYKSLFQRTYSSRCKKYDVIVNQTSKLRKKHSDQSNNTSIFKKYQPKMGTYKCIMRKESKLTDMKHEYNVDREKEIKCTDTKHEYNVDREKEISWIRRKGI